MDPGWKKFGSGTEKSRIRDKYPGSATLFQWGCILYNQEVLWCCIDFTIRGRHFRYKKYIFAYNFTSVYFLQASWKQAFPNSSFPSIFLVSAICCRVSLSRLSNQLAEGAGSVEATTSDVSGSVEATTSEVSPLPDS